MGINKAWLQKLIDDAPTPDVKAAFQTCYDKLVEAPSKAPKQTKIVDHDKLYMSTVDFYIKKGKSIDEANRIAEIVVKQQQEKYLE